MESPAGAQPNITIENMEKAAMPLVVEITYADGAKEHREFPVDIWEYSSIYTFTGDKKGAVTKVIIDPDKIYPDVDRSNNTYELKK